MMQSWRAQLSKKKKKEFKELTVGGEAVETLEFVRTRWKHYLRWIMFSFLMLIFFMLLWTTFKVHVLAQEGFMLKELVLYTMCGLMMIPVGSSIVLEVDYVKVEGDTIVFQNLLIRRSERIEDIVKFIDPVYLKFAIVKTKGFIYFINRRDIPNYQQLFETIKTKAIQLKK
jgi:hypothetical protein